MDIYARARTSIQSWTHDTPLPTTYPQVHSKLQPWHHFHPPAQQWIPIHTSADTINSTSDQAEPSRAPDSELALLTWNIDGASPQTQERVSEIITYITHLNPKLNIIFFSKKSPRQPCSRFCQTRAFAHPGSQVKARTWHGAAGLLSQRHYYRKPALHPTRAQNPR